MLQHGTSTAARYPKSTLSSSGKYRSIRPRFIKTMGRIILAIKPSISRFKKPIKIGDRRHKLTLKSLSLNVLEWQAQSTLSCGELRAMLNAPTRRNCGWQKNTYLDSPQIRRSEDLKAYAQSTFADDEPVLQAAMAFTHKIFSEFKFDPSTTTAATPSNRVLKQRSGVCQDFAHLAIGCLRSVGIPARYMSGYLETLPPPGQAKLGRSGCLSRLVCNIYTGFWLGRI